MKKKKMVLAGIILIFLLIAACIALFFVLKGSDEETGMSQPPALTGMGEDVISASGVTAVGMLAETWELDFLETSLYVEESYLSTGDEVEAGTAVFHVSEETLEKARKELEDRVTEAELAYRQGLLDYEEGTIQAQSTFETAKVSRQYAQAEYDSAVAQAKKNVEDLEQQVEEARELAEEYTKSVEEDYYRTYYKVDELYEVYYEHFTLLMDFYKKWDVETLEDLYGGSTSTQSTGSSSAAGGSGTSGSSSAAGGSGMPSGSNTASAGGASGKSSSGNSGTSGEEQKLSVYQQLDELVGEPALLLADEPTGALDTNSGKDVLALFKQLHELGHSIVMITHDLSVAQCAERIVHIVDGCLEQ